MLPRYIKQGGVKAINIRQLVFFSLEGLQILDLHPKYTCNTTSKISHELDRRAKAIWVKSATNLMLLW